MLDYFLVSKKKIQFNICLYYDSHLRNVKTRDHHSNREEDGHLHWNTTTTLCLGCMLRNNSTDSTEKLLSTRRKRCLRSFIQKTDPQLIVARHSRKEQGLLWLLWSHPLVNSLAKSSFTKRNILQVIPWSYGKIFMEYNFNYFKCIYYCCAVCAWCSVG